MTERRGAVFPKRETGTKVLSSEEYIDAAQAFLALMDGKKVKDIHPNIPAIANAYAQLAVAAAVREQTEVL